LPSQNFIQYPDPKLQIQNSRKLESKFPIKNSDNFTVEITEKNGEKKKYGLEDLAKIVPDDFSEGVLSPQLENNKLKIVTNKKIDESYSNKILIKTGDDSYAVIPSHLIDKTREEVKKLKMEEEEKKRLAQEQEDAFAMEKPPIQWGKSADPNQDIIILEMKTVKIEHGIAENGNSNATPDRTVKIPKAENGDSIKAKTENSSNSPRTVKISISSTPPKEPLR